MKHLVIPDVQAKPGVRLDHLTWIGKYAAEKRPDTIVALGDWFDFPSLSSYDKGKASAEGRRVAKDLAAGNLALDLLETELAKVKGYKPRKVLTLGNHEWRLGRYLEDHAELEGALGFDSLDHAKRGWEVYPFLQPVTIDGITYVHYAPRSSDGSVAQTKRGAPSARAQVMREMRTTVCGHKQGLDTYIHQTGERTIRGIIAGSCYQHDESYLSPQGHKYWKGVLMLHEVKAGNFNLMEVSLDYLKRRYGTTRR